MFWGHVKKKPNSVNLCQNSVFAKCRDVKNEVFENKIAFFVLLLQEKQKMEKDPKKLYNQNEKTDKNGF